MTYYKVRAWCAVRHLWILPLIPSAVELYHPIWRFPGHFSADKVPAGPVDLRLFQVRVVQPESRSRNTEARSSLVIFLPPT